MSTLEIHMGKFIDSIKSAIYQENWYAALTIAVTLPDICCRLDGTKPDNYSREPYIKWFDKYVGDKYRYKVSSLNKEFTRINGNNAYALRCAFLHDGSGDLEGHKARDENLNINEILFLIPENLEEKWGEIKVTFSEGVDGNRLILNIEHYCRRIIEGVEKWILEYKGNDNVLNRLSKMIKISTINELS